MGTVAHIGTQCDGVVLLHVLGGRSGPARGPRGRGERPQRPPGPRWRHRDEHAPHRPHRALAHARTGRSHRLCGGGRGGARLMGARGNSGVILSQVIRGLKDALADGDGVSEGRGTRRRAPARLCRRDEARPRDHAHRARGDGRRSAAPLPRPTGPQDRECAGEPAVRATREQNPMNRAAGVVDGGARGLWLLFDGALPRSTATPTFGARSRSSLRRSRPRSAACRSSGAGRRPAGGLGAARRDGRGRSWEGAYDVQFLVERPTRPLDAVREEMPKYGADCVLVVGDDGHEGARPHAPPRRDHPHRAHRRTARGRRRRGPRRDERGARARDRDRRAPAGAAARARHGRPRRWLRRGRARALGLPSAGARR